MKTRAYLWLAFGFAIALLMLTLSGCGKSSNSKDKSSSSSTSTSSSDGTTTQSATSAIEDLGNSGDTSMTGGVALRRGTRSGHRVAWYERLWPERAAWAANGFTCTGPTWGGAGNLVTLTPGGCSYTNGTTTWTVSWSGAFLFTYSGMGGCMPGHYGSVSGTLAAGCVIVRTTDLTATRSVTDGAKTYAVIHNTHNPSGWDSSVTTDNGGVVITCGSGGCPTVDDTSSTHSRSIAVGGTHLVGTLNGVKFWDHTVSTPASNPIVITGSGQYRVVQSGTVVVQHNLAQATATVTVTSPLIHEPDCAYPVGGSVTAAFTAGKWTGKTETLSFGPACGDASLTDSGGSKSGVELTQ